MTRSGVISVLGLLVLMGCVFAMIGGAVAAEQANFSLATGESVTIGGYTLEYTGFTDGYPTYDLSSEGILHVHLPPDPPPPNWGEYVYGNVSIVTTSVTSDGMTATGTITVS